MKISYKIRDFLLNGVCVSTSLREAIQVVAAIEVVFAIGFMCHGSYLCASRLSNETIYGVAYIFSGIIYWTLTWLLWMMSEKVTRYRYHLWIVSSVLNQFLILVVTEIRRNDIGTNRIASAMIWILCALFLQIYMICMVWAFMLHSHTQKGNASGNYTSGNTKESLSSMKNELAENL